MNRSLQQPGARARDRAPLTQGLAWHSLSKMNSSGKQNKFTANQRKNELRRQYRAQSREALLIKDYVEAKYPEVYEEAANFYNFLNNLYPIKNDLRRTEQFKALKMGFTYVPKKNARKYIKQVFQAIPMTNPSNFTEQTETAQPQGDAEQPIYPEGDAEQPIYPEGDAEQPIYPEGDAEQTKTPHEKIMQLRIPLLKPSVTTRTVQVVTEEILQEKQVVSNEILQENPLQVASNDIFPEATLNEEIPDEIFQKILDELHQDPELHNMMNEIDQEIEFEQLAADIDIPDDRLEQELENMFW